jgi:hypothetical protein
MIRKTFYVIVVLTVLFSTISLHAQEKLQVAEKSLSKTLPFSTQDELKITGDKADIVMSGWDKDFIEIKITLSARHSDKQIAEKELGYMKYSLTKESNLIEVMNTFIIPDHVTRLQSRMTVLFEIKIPANARVHFKNKYCTIRLSDLTANATMQLEFGRVEMNRVSGKFSIENHFGDVQGSDINAQLTCRTDKSFINLQELKGNCTFYSILGSIDLSIHETLQALTIRSSHTPVSLSTKNTDSFQYDLHTMYASVFVPEAYRKYVKATGPHANAFIMGTSKKLIKVITTYSSINFKN